MAKVTLYGTEQMRTLLERFGDMINPRRYYIVTDGESVVVFVPVKTSRHTHYYELQFQSSEELQKFVDDMKKKGFTVVEGSVTFLPG